MVYGRGVKLNQTRGQNPKHTLVRRQTGFTEQIKTESFFLHKYEQKQDRIQYSFLENDWNN